MRKDKKNHVSKATRALFIKVFEEVANRVNADSKPVTDKPAPAPHVIAVPSTKTPRISLLENGIQGALNPCTFDTDNIHACSAIFAKMVGRDTVLEKRNATLEKMPEEQKQAFYASFPFGHNTLKANGPLTELTLEKIYLGTPVAMVLAAVALKEGMDTKMLRNAYADVLADFKDAAKVAELRERFPDLKAKHINRVIRTLGLEDLRADFPDMKEKKLLNALRKFEI